MVKIFYTDKTKTVSFTEKELRKLLEEAYEEGYDKGKYDRSMIYTKPFIKEPCYNIPNEITACDSMPKTYKIKIGDTSLPSYGNISTEDYYPNQITYTTAESK